MFSIIAAVGKNNEIGKSGDLCFRLKDDMKFFRTKTTSHKVVMGHNTWDSLPSKLKDRENIVISKENFPGPDQILHDVQDFIAKNKDTEEEIFVIGGAMVYFEFLKHAKNLYLTEVDATDDSADTFFPAFDKSNYSSEVIKKGKEDDLDYQIIHYIKH